MEVFLYSCELLTVCKLYMRLSLSLSLLLVSMGEIEAQVLSQLPLPNVPIWAHSNLIEVYMVAMVTRL